MATKKSELSRSLMNFGGANKLPLLAALLMCECEKLVFPVNRKIVEMYFPDRECCSMDGAIMVAEMLRPGVKEIRTFSGVELDTVYVKTGHEWGAYSTVVGGVSAPPRSIQGA